MNKYPCTIVLLILKKTFSETRGFKQLVRMSSIHRETTFHANNKFLHRLVFYSTCSSRIQLDSFMKTSE
jgi:hypothetical protein